LLPNGIHGLLADSGSNLSGGQKQRLGIARALLTKPKVLFLDEATSNLDGQTEEKVSSALKNIRNNASIFMIAHRLSTVASADRIIYLESGEIKAQGTFQEVRYSVPDFERQAQLMGL
jgi:ABC-type bacteriocin/lantibiotic exporter with double-glycine peptidase domain